MGSTPATTSSAACQPGMAISSSQSTLWWSFSPQGGYEKPWMNFRVCNKSELEDSGKAWMWVEGGAWVWENYQDSGSSWSATSETLPLPTVLYPKDTVCLQQYSWSFSAQWTRVVYGLHAVILKYRIFCPNVVMARGDLGECPGLSTCW